MVGFATKMKDVELLPFMLGIYKDNEHHHLLHHALQAWQNRLKEHTVRGSEQIAYMAKNPIMFCAYPPMDLVEEYYPGWRSYTLLSSYALKCSDVVTYAFRLNIDHMAELYKLDQLKYQMYGLSRILKLIKFDEELSYQIIIAGLLPLMPEEFHRQLTSEHLATAAICG